MELRKICKRLMLSNVVLFLFWQTAFAESISLNIAEPIPTELAKDASDPQQNVNEFAWRTFFALMRPASLEHRGEVAKHPRHASQRLWETWKEQYEVYPPDGSKPAPWNARQIIPNSCKTSPLYRDEKADDVLDATLQAVKADATLPGTLKDQQGKLVRYEIRFNQVVYDYVVANQLYNGIDQAKASEINFPNGSIIIKAAWKELSWREQDKHFITRDACICNENNGNFSHCRTSKTGLVGFHIMQKTADAPQWIWSTFEHVANTHPTHYMPASFYNAQCQGEHCVPNSQTPDFKNNRNGVPNQVVQLLPISDDLKTLNQWVQDQLGLRDDPMQVLSQYQLMSAQWPTSNTDLKQPKTVFTVEPVFSANTTMETFAQSSSSCMGCHVMSRSLNPDKFVSGDFTFTVNNAQPKPPGAVCGDYDYANSVFCTDELILFSPQKLRGLPHRQSKPIRHGFDLVSNTYERLPNNVGNKLHCSSCHLFAGGDPDASWWVGMSQSYGTKEALQSRINGCFERSMNGFDLCPAGSDCNKNADMNAIIAYMDWLTAQYEQQHNCKVTVKGSGNEQVTMCGDKVVPSGFPKLGFETTTKPGEWPQGQLTAGEAIFQQKCAFCHNDLGQGRYQSHTYFRPALWGPDSYKDNAGMAGAHTLARFLRWNMPYTSGGLLTDQEALDLACFVDSQQRPDKLNFGTNDTFKGTQRAVCQ